LRNKQEEKIMTNKEMVSEILGKYGAMTSKQIAVQLNVKMGVTLTPAQVAGALRPMITKGEVASSKDDRGAMRYWKVSKQW
jgi:hypothetical protein